MLASCRLWFDIIKSSVESKYLSRRFNTTSSAVVKIRTHGAYVQFKLIAPRGRHYQYLYLHFLLHHLIRTCSLVYVHMIILHPIPSAGVNITPVFILAHHFTGRSLKCTRLQPTDWNSERIQCDYTTASHYLRA